MTDTEFPINDLIGNIWSDDCGNCGVTDAQLAILIGQSGRIGDDAHLGADHRHVNLVDVIGQTFFRHKKRLAYVAGLRPRLGAKEDER